MSFGQGKPPASAVPEPYRQKFVQYVDRRSMQEKALNLIGLTSQDVGRSFALIAGVSRYPNMPEMGRELAAAGADIDELQNYLRSEEFFDEIVVLRDGDVTMENLEYFLQDYFPDRLRKSPKSRFLFAYSGHGMAEGSKEAPTGYLLKSTARSLALRIQRQYTRFRRPGRQPPHPGRYRYQSARFRGAPSAHDVFIPRSSAEHLAGVIRATSSAKQSSSWVHG